VYLLKRDIDTILPYLTPITDSFMSQQVDSSRIPELKAVVTLALEEARRAGATQAEADASLQQGFGVTVRLGEVETVEYQRDRGLGITVYFGHRKGSASTADLSTESVRATVSKACAIARYTAEDSCAGLAEPQFLAREFRDLQLDFPWQLTPEAAIVLARECEQAGRAQDPRLSNSEGASVNSQRGVRVYGNSHGFLAGDCGTSHSLSCVLLAQQGDDMQRDYWYTTARDPRDLETAERVGVVAGQRALARLQARRVPTGRVPVMFAPEVARGLMGHFIAAIRGSSQYRKASFLLNAAGEQVFPAWLQIHERPHLPKGLASSNFDGEGVATRDRELVRDGVVDGYLLGSYSARKLGLTTTGHAGGVHNLLIDPSPEGADQAALLRRMGRGLLVTELMGQGVNGVTGDYSRGASGFWVQDGEIAWPVHEVTIAGNLKEMYRGLEAIGTDIDTRGGIRVGSVLLGEMTLAGE
jgi:PmbA protein